MSGFDQITGGGLLRSSVILLRGDFGHKELLARQISWNLLQGGGEVLYYSVDHPVEDIYRHMTAYGWEMQGYEKTGRLKIVDIFTDSVERMLPAETIRLKSAKASTLGESIYDFSVFYRETTRFLLPDRLLLSPNRLVVVDSVSPLILEEAKEAFSFLRAFKSVMEIAKSTGICILHPEMHEDSVLETVESLMDGVLELTRISDSLSLPNLIGVVRYSGEYERGHFPIETDVDGLRVIPISVERLIQENN